MNNLSTFLTKTLVFTFYRRHALALGVVIFVAAGFLRAGEHIALASAAVTSPLVLAGYLLFWLSYAALATLSTCQFIHAHDVMLHWRLFSPLSRLSTMAYIQLKLLQPVLIYAIFVMWIGWQKQQIWAIGVIMAFLFLMLAGAILAYEYTLRHPNPVMPWAGWGSQVRRWATTPYELFWFRHLFTNYPFGLLRTKLVNCLVWLGILKLYLIDHNRGGQVYVPDYDLRLLGLGLLLVGLGHAPTIYQHYQFEHGMLPLYRNMPISSLGRWVRYLGQFALLLLPELLLLLRYLPTDLPAWQSLTAWSFGLSLLMVVHGQLLRTHQPIEQIMTWLFKALILYFLLIMYHVPLWLLTGINLALAWWLFQRCYWLSAWKSD